MTQGKIASDTTQRKQAAVRALELVRLWPQGNHSMAKSSMSAEDLNAFEERFVSTFAGGTPVACRIAFFHHIGKWCQQRRVDLWNLGWPEVESYMWAPSRKGRVSATIARKRFHDFAWLRKYSGFPVDLAG